ncbi:MAG: pyridoxamine 5'-phosphate oxidase family protein, partial [Aeromicrobium sp.]
MAFVDADGVQLLPLNFAVIDDEIYFRTATDSTLHQLAEGLDDVAFEIDHHAEASPVGWNVTVKGSTSRVSDPELRDRVMAWE